jgi:hypothetical protein
MPDGPELTPEERDALLTMRLEVTKAGGDAEYWRGQLVEVCRWVLGMATLAG